MKRKKWAIVLQILAIISAVVAMAISVFYYVSLYQLSLASIALAVRNTIACFAFVPSLSVTEVLQWLSGIAEASETPMVFGSADLYSFVNDTLIHIYAFIILLAPVCTATALYVFIAKAFRKIKWKVVLLFKKKPQEKVMIIGSGRTASDLILSENKVPSGREIYYVSAEAKTVDEEADLLRQKVRFSQIDLVNCSDKEFSAFLKNYKMDSMHAIILCEKSDAANFSIYIRLMKLGKEQISGRNLICCKCEDTGMMNLITNYYDDHKEQCIPPKMFSIAQMRVDANLERQPLPVCSKGENLSLLVVGFGMTGQNMVRNMMNLGVAHSQSKLTIHVVDVDMDLKKDIFLRHFSPDYVTISEHQCMIGSDRADGMLEIHFHKMDVRSRDFEKLLKDSDVQYASICMENIDYCLDCMQNIEGYITRYNKEQLPIVVSLLSDPEITAYLNKDTKRFDNVYFIGAGTYCNINQILAASMEKGARKFHHLYQNLSVLTLKEYQEKLAKGKEDPGTPWEDMLFYKQESSRMLSRHQYIKDTILKELKAADKDFSMDRYFGEEGSLLQKKGESYLIKDSMEELVRKLNADPVLKEFGSMEHRRWCYCQAMQGWSYAVSKNETKKQSPYMVPWDQLSREHPEVCIYDYMAYLL